MPPTDDRKPGERARWLREQRDIDRREFAKRVGMPYSTLADWENGRIVNTGKTPVHVIAAELGANLDWILTGKGTHDAPAPNSPPIAEHQRIWGFDLSFEGAALGADWMKLSADEQTAMAEVIRTLVKRRIETDRKATKPKRGTARPESRPSA